MTAYRVALIGTGRVAYQFSFSDLPDNHAEAVSANQRCQLVAGVNRGREKLDAFGQRFGVDALFQDYRKMLAEVRPDVCIIATHPELHGEMVEACAAVTSTRAIICEKPMALSLEECDRMISACETAGVLLQINHNRLWHPEWILAKKLLDDGAIGRLNYIHCFMNGGKPSPSWRSDNEGPLLHDFTHYFDLMDLYGGAVDWLCGMAEQRQRPWAVEDFAASFMRFKSAVTGVIHASELTEYTENAFVLNGSTGVIRMIGEQVHLLQATPSEHDPDSGFRWSALEESTVNHPPAVSTYCVALDELLDALEGKTALRSDGRVGRRSLEIVSGIYQSQLEDNRPVSFPVSLAGSGVQALGDAGQFSARDTPQNG